MNEYIVEMTNIYKSFGDVKAVQGGHFNLKKGEITEAERLLQLRELQTRYRFAGGLELSYTFGSIYNNVVNPRFSESHFHF